jgi:hypothetical protein
MCSGAVVAVPAGQRGIRMETCSRRSYPLRCNAQENIFFVFSHLSKFEIIQGNGEANLATKTAVFGTNKITFGHRRKEEDALRLQANQRQFAHK